MLVSRRAELSERIPQDVRGQRVASKQATDGQIMEVFQ